MHTNLEGTTNNNIPIACSKHCFFFTTWLAAEVNWTYYQIFDGGSHWSRRNNRRFQTGWNSGIQQSTQISEISYKQINIPITIELHMKEGFPSLAHASKSKYFWSPLINVITLKTPLRCTCSSVIMCYGTLVVAEWRMIKILRRF